MLLKAKKSFIFSVLSLKSIKKFGLFGKAKKIVLLREQTSKINWAIGLKCDLFKKIKRTCKHSDPGATCHILMKTHYICVKNQRKSFFRYRNFSSFVFMFGMMHEVALFTPTTSGKQFY